MPSEKPIEMSLATLYELVFAGPGVDMTAMKCLLTECVGRIKQHGGGKPSTRELSLAATKLQEATFWIDEYQRLS